MVQAKTGGRGVCSQERGLLIFIFNGRHCIGYVVNANLNRLVRLTPAPRDNDEEALLTFIEDQFVFDKVQKTDHTNQKEEELAEDEFIAKVFLNSIIVGNNSIYVSTSQFLCFVFPSSPSQ